MRNLIMSLTDDPLDPPGADRYGGAQLFMFNLGRYLVRAGNDVTFVTRKSRPDKPDIQDLGPSCRIHRLQVGPAHELPHHDLWLWEKELLEQSASLLKKLPAFSSVLSYNWLSGLMALEGHIDLHVHHILSLGRVRAELGEEPHESDTSRDHGELKVFRRATRLICTCHDELSSLKRLYPEVDHSKALIIPYPVESDAYSKRPLDSGVFLRWKAKGLAEGA